MNLSVNERAMDIVKKVLDDPGLYGVEVIRLGNGSTVLDFSKGSYAAGVVMGEVCMGGLGSVSLVMDQVGGVPVPAVVVETSHPKVACLGSQYAGWSINIKKEVDGKKKKVFFMGSGPARARARVEKELYGELGYADDSDVAVIVLEADKLPDDDAMGKISEKCGLDPSKVTALCAPTASIPGSVQIAARIVETGIHKLHELHFDLDWIKHGVGTTTVAPVNPKTAMGCTNDSIIYGGKTFYTVEIPKDKEAAAVELLEKAPSNKSKSYGKPFFEEFKEKNFDFYQIDPGLFAPAVITVNNRKTGKTFSFGEVNEGVLKQSYGLK
ncbi:MAG: methenyltetrahydromethanopterin cyclohydrolase [Promethearchaeota archaeon]